jgi:predicted O-methyltransferase YrrM
MMYVPNGGIVVEIGSWMGGSSEQLAQGIGKYCPKTMLYCVDPFDEEYFNKTPGLQKKIKKTGVKDVLEFFTKRMERYNYELFRMKSSEAVNQKDIQLRGVDFVFIDGNHDYEYVKQDIDLWFHRLNDGGIMCGHDYGKWGVEKAVDEVFVNDQVNFPADSIWMMVR